MDPSNQRPYIAISLLAKKGDLCLLTAAPETRSSTNENPSNNQVEKSNNLNLA
jgi:hypothetical protein